MFFGSTGSAIPVRAPATRARPPGIPSPPSHVRPRRNGIRARRNACVAFDRPSRFPDRNSRATAIPDPLECHFRSRECNSGPRDCHARALECHEGARAGHPRTSEWHPAACARHSSAGVCHSSAFTKHSRARADHLRVAALAQRCAGAPTRSPLAQRAVLAPLLKSRLRITGLLWRAGNGPRR